MRTMRFEIRKSDDGQFYWALVGANNEVLGTSETMHNKSDVIDICITIGMTIGSQVALGTMKITDKTGDGDESIPAFR